MITTMVIRIEMPPRVRRDIRTTLIADIVLLRHRVMPYLMCHRIVMNRLVLRVVMNRLGLSNPVVLMRRGVILL